MERTNDLKQVTDRPYLRRITDKPYLMWCEKFVLRDIFLFKAFRDGQPI